MFSPLRDPVYRRLFGALVTALLGTGLMTIALALLAFELAGENAGTVLGTALAVKMVAYVLVAPIVGGLGHLLPRKTFLIGLDLARAATVLGLPFVTEPWHVYGLIFVLNAASAAFTPTFQATIPDVLEEPDYTRALALSRFAYDIENLVSPLLAGLALLLLQPPSLFVVTALAFLASAAWIASVALPRPRPVERGHSVLRNLGFGLEAYGRTPRLRGVLALSLAVAAAGAMIIVNTVVLVRAEMGLGAGALALAMAAAGIGSMSAALALPLILERFSDRRVMLAGALILTATMLTASVTAPGYTALLALWVVLGSGLALVQTPIGRVLTRSSTAGDRPAYFAAQFALSHGCWLVTYPLAGALASLGGSGLAFAGLTTLTAFGMIAAGYLWPAADPLELDHAHDATDHEHLHVHDAHHAHDHEGWEGPEPHRHPHRHAPLHHRHAYAIDLHHPAWPR